MAFEFKVAREEAESIFAVARRILSGRDDTLPPPEPIDLKSGIGRALRMSQRGLSARETQAHAAARSIAVVEGTLVAIDAIDACLAEAHELVSHALAAADPQARALFAARFAELCARVDTIAAGAVFQGVNLINLGRDKIEIVSPVGSQPRHEIGHIVLVAGERGLGLRQPRDHFRDDQDIESCASGLTHARARLIKAADTFLNQASMMAPFLTAETAAA